MSKLIEELDDLISIHIVSLDKHYKTKIYKDITLEEKIELINQAMPIIFTEIFNSHLQIREWKVLGQGTLGIVFQLNFENAYNKFENLKSTGHRHMFSEYTEYPNTFAVKVQLLATDSSYMEKRMLREEHVMQYLTNKTNNAISGTDEFILKDVTPRFYFGFTYPITIATKQIYVRFTFMELISLDLYKTVEDILSDQYYVLDETRYNNIEKVVKALWKVNVSHNDLSTRNILVGYKEQSKNKVKIIDYGLSEIFAIDFNIPSNVSAKKHYTDLFKNEDTAEQRGSNVKKLKNLCADMYRRDNHDIDRCCEE